MIETSGRVIRVEGDHAWVEAQRRAGCDGCEAAAGCGSGALASVFGRRAVRVRALNAAGARAGDEVTVALDEGAMLRGVVAVYLVPLLGLLAGGIAVGAVAGGDGPALAGAAAGFAAGLALARAYAGRWRRGARAQPVIVARRRDLCGC
ncbi:SoxR reducing system RseC family protein [Inmirania thermothiophila]|uniref:RseC/MucC-like positive regulator of sigma(E) n=1 Tax=Inmirania thermothiophila TaxID=1750597 RepID=A0A3N1XZU5_9GAMM|nr:SoxR reducing system RseC family protein [Inmirania thermothiophila]ROR32125.1 RseC/MucC-like positive regulator of sigma(E) [Inmirania thermothiophila]